MSLSPTSPNAPHRRWGRFPDEMSALALVFGVLEEDRLKWRSIPMDAVVQERIKQARVDIQQHPLILDEIPESVCA